MISTTVFANAPLNESPCNAEVSIEGDQVLPQLLERLSKAEIGSEDAFVEWLGTYVRGAVRRRLLPLQDIEDATQQILMRCQEKNISGALLDVHTMGGRPHSFLAVVVAHAIIDLARKFSRREKREIAFAPQDLTQLNISDSADDPFQNAVRAETSNLIRSLLSSLGEKDRRVLMLHYGFYGTPEAYSTIGEKCGLKAEAAKKRGFRALKMLGRLLAKSDFL